jgi:hypothetical protein
VPREGNEAKVPREGNEAKVPREGNEAKVPRFVILSAGSRSEPKSKDRRQPQDGGGLLAVA